MWESAKEICSRMAVLPSDLSLQAFSFDWMESFVTKLTFVYTAWSQFQLTQVSSCKSKKDNALLSRVDNNEKCVADVFDTRVRKVRGQDRNRPRFENSVMQHFCVRQHRRWLQRPSFSSSRVKRFPLMDSYTFFSLANLCLYVFLLGWSG